MTIDSVTFSLPATDRRSLAMAATTTISGGPLGIQVTCTGATAGDVDGANNVKVIAIAVGSLM